jgi:hypothetical protein
MKGKSKPEEINTSIKVVINLNDWMNCIKLFKLNESDWEYFFQNENENYEMSHKLRSALEKFEFRSR